MSTRVIFLVKKGLVTDDGRGKNTVSKRLWFLSQVRLDVITAQAVRNITKCELRGVNKMTHILYVMFILSIMKMIPNIK